MLSDIAEERIDQLRSDIKTDNYLHGISGGFCTMRTYNVNELPLEATGVYGTDPTNIVMVFATFGIQADVVNEVHIKTYLLCTKTLKLSLVDGSTIEVLP